MAAVQVVALGECLRVVNADLSARFYRAAAEGVSPVWAINEANDRPPATDATRALRGSVFSWSQRAAVLDPIYRKTRANR